MIPKNFIQFCDNYSRLPKLQKRACNNNRVLLSDFKYYMFDDELARRFIKKYYPKYVYHFFLNNKIPSSRSDMLRLMILYHIGGVYLDTAIELSKNITYLLSFDHVFLKRDDFSQYKENKSLAHVTNSFIFCRPRSPIIAYSLGLMLKNIASGNLNYDVINCTGPGVLNRSLEKFSGNLHATKFLYVSSEVNLLFKNRRVSGYSSNWLSLQKNGIVDFEALKPERIPYFEDKYFTLKRFLISFLKYPSV